MEQSFAEKMFVITGATSGIGQAAVEMLARQGARLIGVGRSAERCQASERRLNSLYPQAKVHYLAADLSVQGEVWQLAERVHETMRSLGMAALDGLVNNAGTFTYWLTLTPDGIETQWAVNHLAPFLLTCQLLPLLRAAPLARIVTVSSDSHYTARMDWEDPQMRRHYNGLLAYGNTKLANILFSRGLNDRLGPLSSVRAFAADPGLVKTDIGLKGTPPLAHLAWKIRRSGGVSPQEAAEGILYLLAEPSVQNSEEVYWKQGQPKRASTIALDRQAAEKLWDLSERMCGISMEALNVPA